MINNKYLSSVVISILAIMWSTISLYLLMTKVPWPDEVRAWSIAYNLPWYQLFDLVRYEGHYFLWFMLLKILVWLHVPYPWGMYGLNWLIGAGGIYLILAKSPFSWVVKTAAMFSYPLLIIYPVYARPYGLAVLGLFLLATFYSQRLAHPRTYACLLFMCAHTALCGTIGAVAFGGIYVYDMWRKERKNIWKNKRFRGGLLICAFTAVCLLFECVGYQRPAYRVLEPIWDTLQFLSWPTAGECVLFCIFMCCIHQGKRALFFLIFSCGSWVFVNFYCYTLAFWHQVFFTIYLLVAAWIFMMDVPCQRGDIKGKLISILIIAACIIGYKRIGFYWVSFENGIKAKEFVEDNIEVLSKGNIITFHSFEGWGIWPYLHEQGIRTYSMHTGLDEMSLEHIRLNYSRLWIPSYDKTVSLLKKDRINLFIITEKMLKEFNKYYFQYEPYQLQLKKIYCSRDLEKLCLFEIDKDPKDKR